MKYVLELTVFLCGASLMILELVGSRILAPYIGTSTVIWTSLIGIILAFLSLGYFIGGKMADKKATYGKLGLVILASAFFIFFIIIINQPILSLIRENIKNIYWSAIISTLILFSTPSFLLGIVSPYAIRLKIKNLEESGRTAGNLYAVSTIGSIVGTFAAGFVLIPFLGTIKILYFIVFILVFSSFATFLKESREKKFFSLFLILFFFAVFFFLNKDVGEASIIDVDTEYNRIRIFDANISGQSRPVRVMTTDPFSIQSGMFLDTDNDIVFDYLKYYRLADHFSPNLKKALLFGGAAYGYPKDFLRNHKDATIDVVEIDRGMTDLARKYFNLKDDPRLNIYHEDGRVFLNNNNKKYDVILIDAFNSRLSVPYQLTTSEAVKEIYESLEDDGLVLLNLISSFSGKKSKFLQAQYATYKNIFPQVFLFQVDDSGSEEIQNIILAGFKSDKILEFESDNKEFDKCLKRVWKKEVMSDFPPLTDDYAPIDYYMMNAI